MVTTVRADALATTADLTQAGVVFNDATRLLEGGLWQNATVHNNQTPSLGMYVQDMNAVLSDVQSVSANLTVGSAQANDLATIQSLIPTLLAAAQTSVVTHGSEQAAAEATLHDGQLQIINTIQNDPALLAAASNGATGFQAVAPGLAAGITAANAPVANLADVGALFNDAANLMIGGVNSANHATIQADLKAASAGLQNLITNDPAQFGTNGTTADPLTLIHAQTVVNQLNLQIHNFDNSHTADAGRANNDNMLDMIDIIQGDKTLLANATQGGGNGFAAQPDYLTGTINKFQDNAAQTHFWANFIVGANNLSTEAAALVGSGDTKAVNALIDQIQHYEASAGRFDQSQGGIFAARFQNELGTHAGTLSADATAMIQGLKTGNAAEVQAAGQGFIADAADVSGNNVPVGGGTFNTAGTTIAQVLSTAGGSPMAGGQGGGDDRGGQQGGHGYDHQHFDLAAAAAAPVPVPDHLPVMDHMWG